MAFVAITRLHLASFWSFPGFLFRTLRVARQVSRAPGFISGWLGSDAERGLWTVTVWDNAEAMQAFRRSGAHSAAMPTLLGACDEASVGHWEQADRAVPSGDEVYERMRREGRLSKVNRPSVRQQAGETVGHGKPRPGRTMAPAG